MSRKVIISLVSEWELADNARETKDEVVQQILRVLEQDTPEATISAKRTRLALQEIE